MYNEFRLIIIFFVGKYDCLSIDFRILSDGLDIFSNYKQTLFDRTCTFRSNISFQIINHKMPLGCLFDVKKCP